MGCSSSKTVCRTKTLRENSNPPLPRVTAIPILEDFLLARDHDQFVALICRAKNLAKKFPSTTESETMLSSIGIDNEEDPKLQALMKQKCTDEKSTSRTVGKVNFDSCLGSLMKGEGSEKNESAEEAKLEIINTWELMEGLEEGETGSEKIEADSGDPVSVRSSKICVEAVDESALPSVSRTIGKPKSMGNFHTVEDYDAFLSISKRSLWDTSSESFLYHLGQERLELIADSRLNTLHRSSSVPPTSKSRTPIIIDWVEDLKCDDDCPSEILNSLPVLQASCEQSETKNEISSEQKNDVAEIFSGKNDNRENNQIIEMAAENDNISEGSLRKDHPTDRNSSKRCLRVRAKVNELGGISIPSTPDFSAAGSFKEWLYGGGHLYSPGITVTPRFGYSGIWSRRSRPDNSPIHGQASSNEDERGTISYPVSNTDKQMESGGQTSVYCDSGVSVAEKEQWDYPVFDPDLLAYFEKALEQLSEEEQHALNQIYEDSNERSKDCHPKDGEDGSLLNSSKEDIGI